MTKLKRLTTILVTALKASLKCLEDLPKYLMPNTMDRYGDKYDIPVIHVDLETLPKTHTHTTRTIITYKGGEDYNAQEFVSMACIEDRHVSLSRGDLRSLLSPPL